MPLYPGAGRARLLRPNQQGFFFDNEPAAVGMTSIAFSMDQITPRADNGFSVQALFSGAPGPVTLIVQGAELDRDDAYVTVSNMSTVSATNAMRGDYVNNRPKFIRLFINALTNAVNLTALVTR